MILFQTMEYHVKWDKHERNIGEAFQSLRHDEHLCDVTLACEGLQFQAHKVVLLASNLIVEKSIVLILITHIIIHIYFCSF